MHCAVVGHPVAHSLSPALYRAAYSELGLDWSFEAVDVPEGGLSAFVGGLDNTWRGLAVTMPHKASAAALGCADQAVKRLGVANTVVLGKDGVSVHNTDVSGFIRALEYRHVDDLAKVVVLGAGATARAALMALNNLGVERVTAQVRDVASPNLAAWLKLADDLGLTANVEPLGTLHPADLGVSTLPPGQADEWADGLAEGVGAILDVAYDPWPTRLSAVGAAANLPVVTGLDLLAGQAVQQIDYLVGDTVDLPVLLAAGEAELNRRRMA